MTQAAPLTCPTVRFRALEAQVSSLGFGCASLGSRVSERAGLKALEAAFQAGVTWFDVAPSYGDGEAERILGSFLSGKRDRLFVCTKVGISSGEVTPIKRLLRPALRLALHVAPGTAAIVKRHRPPASKARITPNLIRQSVDRSLSRLRCDYIDVLALHDADESEVRDPLVAEAVMKLRQSGKIRTASIASSAEVVSIGLECHPVYEIGQFSNNFADKQLECWRRRSGPQPSDLITHSAFAPLRTISSDELSDPVFAEVGYGGSAASAVARFAGDYAFASNPDGVVIVSMYNGGHLNWNIEARARAPSLERVTRLAAHLRSPVTHP